MRPTVFLIIFTLLSFSAEAQHYFKGHIDNERWQNQVYLSVIDDYRTISGIHEEQILSKVSADTTGFFQFHGNQLDTANAIYKLHVDNCSTNNVSSNHFSGHCNDSKDIIFIAKNTDTITFPLSFDDQMFCDIVSTNPKTATFIKIDSLKEAMKFAYTEYRSEANRKLNNKKWFKTLHEFSKQLNEPLAELYAYAFISDRGNNLHEYYLEDLKSNTYYDELLVRLKEKYPNSSYTNQYEAELASDKFIISKNSTTFNWNYVLYIFLAASLLTNVWLIFFKKHNQKQSLDKAKEQLTNQEQNILKLLLDEKTNKEIADTLFVSLSTVKTHVNNIYKKLNVQSRDEVRSLFNK